MPSVVRYSDKIPCSQSEESARHRGHVASKTDRHHFPTAHTSEQIFQPETEQHSYQNVPDFLKQDVNRLIEYDSLLGKLFSTSERESSQPRQDATSSVVSNSRALGIKPPLKSLTSKVLEKLCEYVRMDKGLPLARPSIRRRLDKSEPVVLPKVNRAVILRNEHVRKKILIRDLAQHKVETITKVPTDPLKAYRKALQRAKDAAKKKKSRHPPARLNKVYELRYQHNKGEPIMPTRFKHWYDIYKKPPFKIVSQLELPKKYLLPVMPKNAISLLGLSTDPTDLGRSLAYAQKTVTADQMTRQKARPKLKKGKHVLRRTKPSMRTGKRPWNYGTFRSDSRWHV